MNEATKLKIDLGSGLVEVEGSEAFVREVYSDFRESLSSGPKPDTAVKELAGGAAQSAGAAKAKKENGQRSSGKKAGRTAVAKQGSTLSIDRDLVLSGAKGKESLATFCSKHSTSRNQERNVVFVYYLTDVLELNPVTANHVYTCYRDMPNVKIPGNLVASLRKDSGRRNGWLTGDFLNDIRLTERGRNFVEHDLKPRAE